MRQIASSSQLRAVFWRWLLVCVPGINLLGFLSASVAMSGPGNPWFAALAKPGLYPPPIAFPIVWTLLYGLMGMALAMILSARAARGRGLAFAAFAVHLAANLAWSPLFFGAHQITWALLDAALMALSLLLVMGLFARIRPQAALLLLPYLAWVLFAMLLNWQLLTLNPAADGQAAPPAARIQFKTVNL